MKREVGCHTNIFHSRSKFSEQNLHVSKMVSDSDEEEFPGFEVEEAEGTGVLHGQLNDESDISGPNSTVPEDGLALDFFLLIWPEALKSIKIVEETNRKAEQYIWTKLDPGWYDTTCDKMQAFILLNMFGIKVLPETRVYWSKDPFRGMPTIQKIMPENHAKESL